MHILIIGGTVFLGRHLVTAARERGHAVTIFHRGQHASDALEGVEEILGEREREHDLDRLADRRWDAVIDTCAYVPRQVRATTATLLGRVDRYVFISTISVYPEGLASEADEDTPLLPLPEDASAEEMTNDTYGPLKALCEQVALKAFAGRATVIRPGLIVGPYDPTDRFTYWPRRVARGGEILAPGDPARPVQFIDVRDLADFAIHLIERSTPGIFHGTGPGARLTMGELLAACQDAIGSEAALTWIPDQFLLDHEVGPWMELPLWIPEGQMPGLLTVSLQRSLAAGIAFRSLAMTVRDTLAWDRTRPANTEHHAGLDGAKEAAVLASWRE